MRMNRSKIGAIKPSGVFLTPSNKSDEQFEKEIMNLARRDAAAGKNSRFTRNKKNGSGTNEWHQLFNDYTYAKSVNRNQIINNAPRRNDVGANYAIYRDAYGNPVAHFSKDTGWSYVNTPAENAREQDFMKKWDKATATAKQEVQTAREQAEFNAKIKGVNTDMLIWGKSHNANVDEKYIAQLISNGGLDFDKLAAHGITVYDETGNFSVNRDILDKKV